jgi:hypothetical protein
MTDKHTESWIDYYHLSDIPKRYWVAPKTYDALKAEHKRKVAVAEVKAIVKDRLWYNLFYIGIASGVIVIVCSILQAVIL